MPSARARIPHAIADAFLESGVVALPVAGAERPMRFLVAEDGATVSVWIYIWTLTHGGRPTLPDEFRIQMTGVNSPLSENPSGPTLILGYDQDLGVFAGFDLTRHRIFTAGSPSVQIDRYALHLALQNGLGFDRKANQEVAIGVRADHLWKYALSARELHESGESPETVSFLESASTGEISIVGLEEESAERRRLVTEVARYARKASFRQQVLSAYQNRCAVSRWQMNLVEAAHILPVAAGSESIDVVRNGLALSPTYHRAFDRALIYLTADWQMRLNPAVAQQLRDDDLGSGLQGLEESLGLIHLPLDPQQRPSSSFINKANEYRGITA